MAGMPIQEALACAALKQWRYERTAIHQGKVSQAFKNPGRPTAKTHSCRYDAALVRTIDFERCFSRLTLVEQHLLLFCVADRQSQEAVSQMLHISPRAINYKLPQARAHLAEILERSGLI